MCKKFIAVVVLLLVLGIFSLYSISPSLNREWSRDQAVLPVVEFVDEDSVHIKNVRNFIYSSTTEYVVQYYDTTVDISTLSTVDYIVEPFGDIGAAHTFVSFGFSDGQRIAISVEIRKEKGESFSPWKGLLRQYELMYVIADERDVINLRANHRNHDVYVYPTTAMPDQAAALFRSMLSRAELLTTKPEFYNTLTSNCTTNIVSHINEIGEREILWDYRLLLPEHSDVLAKELGFIAPDMSIKEARVKYKVNEQARRYKDESNFSELIRNYSTSTSEI